MLSTSQFGPICPTIPFDSSSDIHFFEYLDLYSDFIFKTDNTFQSVHAIKQVKIHGRSSVESQWPLTCKLDKKGPLRIESLLLNFKML